MVEKIYMLMVTPNDISVSMNMPSADDEYKDLQFTIA